MSWTQIDRPFRLKCTLGDDALLLDSFEGQERVSAPFRYLLRVLTEDPDLDMKGLLKSPLVLTIVQSNKKKERHIHGNVSRIKLLNTGEDSMAAYQIEMVPAFWFLNLFADCRIFQNQKIPDIIEKVFADRGITNYRLDLKPGNYQPVEFCVQYRETDFNFVSRLMEREGIYYYFEQSADDHTMVLVDSSGSLKPSPHDSAIEFSSSSGGAVDDDTIYSFESELQVLPGTASLRDYDFKKPATDLSGSLSGAFEGEIYDYPGDYLTKDAADRYSRIRLEEHEVRTSIVRAESNCLGIECGYKFTLAEHYRKEANQEYFVTALWQYGRNTSYSSKAAASSFAYRNRTESIPSSIPYRPPPLARKPVIEGVQTAVVVGKAGEEIWTDEYGRVVVQFFWDREGKCDQSSSCWIRVAQDWAGKNWGGIALPRIGQEVIVTFLEGDPDRPIITGRVYNADQMPPYTLPDDQTRSTVKSMSSKGGGGFNELRFEDKKGSEQVFLHAEKDLDLRVKHARKEWIGSHRHLVTGGSKLEQIGKNEHTAVTGNRSESIGGDHYLKITGDEGIEIGGAHSMKVSKDVTESIDGAWSAQAQKDVYIKGRNVVIEGGTQLTICVGGNFVTSGPSGVSIQGTMVLVNSGGAAGVGVPGTPVTLTDPKAAKVADDATPGGQTSPPTPNPAVPKKIALAKISPATAQAEDDEDEEAAPTSPVTQQPRTSKSEIPEYSTFPKNVDAVAIAGVLTKAAQTGVPFCEECEKAKQAEEAAK